MVLTIFLNVVLPMLLLVGIGSLLQWFKPLDMATLSRITVWLLVPSFLFVRVYESNLSWGQIGSVAVVVMLPVVVVGLAMFAVLRAMKLSKSTVAALVMSAVVVNAGNFGVPVAELAYREPPLGQGLRFEGMAEAGDGVAVQALCVLFSNLILWCGGYAIMSWIRGDGWRGALGYFKLPMIYAIVLAFIMRDFHVPVPKLLWAPAKMLADATVPVMLITLGAQLVKNARWPHWKIVGPVVLVKLIVMPAATAGIVLMLGVWPWPGAGLVIAASAPAAVNVLILALEMDGDAELAAECVFWSTVVSAVTVTVVIGVVAGAGGK